MFVLRYAVGRLQNTFAWRCAQLKARDLGSATLRGRFVDGVYIAPAKSLITSAQVSRAIEPSLFSKPSIADADDVAPLFRSQLEELKAEEQLNKVRLSVFYNNFCL